MDFTEPNALNNKSFLRVLTELIHFSLSVNVNKSKIAIKMQHCRLVIKGEKYFILYFGHPIQYHMHKSLK